MTYKKQKVVGFISEKGGVGKSSLLVGIVKVLRAQKQTVIINMDESSYSIYHLLSDAGLDSVEYYDYDWSGLPKLLSAGIVKFPYVFIDFKGEQISDTQLASISEYVDYFILPIVPSKSNMGAFDHSLEMFNKLEKGKVVIVFCLLNNVKIDSEITKAFTKKITNYNNVVCHTAPIYTVRNMEDKGKTIVNNKTNRDSIHQLIKDLKIK